MRCSGDARRNCERAQQDIDQLAAREDQLRAAAGNDAAAGAGETVDSPVNTVLCRSCWQAAIMAERKTGVSRLRGYRRRHPTGAVEQCGGKTWW
jgi:hypothetical protein